MSQPQVFNVNDYPCTVHGNSDKSCSKQLSAIQTVALHDFKRYRAQARVLSDIKNGAALSLFGLGTTAGLNLVQDGSKAQLRTLGLWAAGIAGFDKVLGLSGQHDTYVAAENAVLCSLNVDAALDQAGMAGRGPELQGAMGRLGMPSSSAQNGGGNDQSESKVQESINDLSFSGATAYGLIKSKTVNTTTAEGAALTFVLLNSLAYINEATAEGAKLVSALHSETQPNARAQNLQNAINKINAAVESRLYKNTNLSAIYSAMVDGLKQQAGASVQAQAKSKNAATKANAAGAGAVLSASNTHGLALASMFMSAQTVTNNSQVEQLASTYDSCVNMMAAPSPAKGPSSPPGTNGASNGGK